MASNLSHGHFDSLAAAKAAGAATINYGVLMNAVINFLIVDFAIFLLVRRGKRVSAAHLGRDTLSPLSPWQHDWLAEAARAAPALLSRNYFFTVAFLAAGFLVATFFATGFCSPSKTFRSSELYGKNRCEVWPVVLR